MGQSNLDSFVEMVVSYTLMDEVDLDYASSFGPGREIRHHSVGLVPGTFSPGPPKMEKRTTAADASRHPLSLNRQYGDVVTLQSEECYFSPCAKKGNTASKLLR